LLKLQGFKGYEKVAQFVYAMFFFHIDSIAFGGYAVENGEYLYTLASRISVLEGKVDIVIIASQNFDVIVLL
jgi:hypothetical protein